MPPCYKPILWIATGLSIREGLVSGCGSSGVEPQRAVGPSPIMQQFIDWCKENENASWRHDDDLMGLLARL